MACWGMGIAYGVHCFRCILPAAVNMLTIFLEHCIRALPALVSMWQGCLGCVCCTPCSLSNLPQNMMVRTMHYMHCIVISSRAAAHRRWQRHITISYSNLVCSCLRHRHDHGLVSKNKKHSHGMRLYSA